MKSLFNVFFANYLAFSGVSDAKIPTQETVVQSTLEENSETPTLADVSPRHYHWLTLTNPIPTASHYPNTIQYLPSNANKIVYFDAYWGASEQPVADGYYRKILGKTVTGQMVVQDFFQSNNAVQSSPMVLDDNDIYALSSVGLTYSFHKNGNLQHIFYSTETQVSETVYVKNQKYVARSVMDGKDNLVNEKLYLLDDNQQIYAYTYLPNNQNIFTVALFYPNQSMRYWKTINLETREISEKAWDINGKAIQPTQAMRLESISATEKTKSLYLLDIMDKVIDYMKNEKG